MKRVRYRAVEALSGSGELLGQFFTLREAAEWASSHASAIQKATKRPGEASAGGYLWREWKGGELEREDQPRVCAKCNRIRKPEEFRCKTGRRRTYCNSCEIGRNKDYRKRKAARGEEELSACLLLLGELLRAASRL